MRPSSPVSEINGVGPTIAQKLDNIGIFTVGDLIHNYPRKYDDYSQVSGISSIKPGKVSIKASIKQVNGKYVRRGLHITEAVASDKSGSVRLVWFNQPYRANAIKAGAQYYISGNFELSYKRLSIMNPSMELADTFQVSTARIIPIYKETKGLTSLMIRKVLRSVLSTVNETKETLPNWIVKKDNLTSKSEALSNIHFPENSKQLEEARKRLGFEELFEISLASQMNKVDLIAETATKIPFKEVLAKQFVGSLPYKLTDSQRRAVWQIYLDLAKPSPMNRLLEGDVGSGKTVVATMSALMAMEQGYQVALMVPTELLARQHAETIFNMLEPLGFSNQVSLLVGSLTPSQKKTAHSKIINGEIKLIIGTHALIANKVRFKNLSFVIVDEQHRFGVEQRKKLLSKAGTVPHVLTMTATPIPRSLALTLYGEMEISIIYEKPVHQKDVDTKIYSPVDRNRVYEKIKKELDLGRQAFVVTPLIQESKIVQQISAEKKYQEISDVFSKYKVGLLHGKQKTETKNAVMEKFVAGKIDILVSTTVVEVGVDVPNATVMVIESPERFGLAQIHQLRGRVGRGKSQGYCMLMLSDNKPPGQRLHALETSNDGFKLAELDLEIRGPGAIYGVMQHGKLDLAIAKLTDVHLISKAKLTAQQFIEKGENISSYPELNEKVSKLRQVSSLN